MTLAIRDGGRGVTIRATGEEARRLRRAIAAALASEYDQNASEPIADRSKTSGKGMGASVVLRASCGRFEGGAHE